MEKIQTHGMSCTNTFLLIGARLCTALTLNNMDDTYMDIDADSWDDLAYATQERDMNTRRQYEREKVEYINSWKSDTTRI